MHTLYFERISRWLVRFVHIQLFLTLFSLPILIAWGLPISIMSPVGNLIFSPIFTLYLFLCSLLFFTELLHIPNELLVTMLEYVNDWWLYLLSYNSKSWLIGFKQPSWYVLVALPLLALLIMMCKKTNSPKRSIICFSVVLILFYVYGSYSHRAIPAHIKITCNRGQLHVIKSNNQTILIDPGFLGQRMSAASYVEYTLAPTLIQKTGITKIDHIVILQPSCRTFEAVNQLCTSLQVRNVYIPYWQGNMSRSALRNFMQLKKTIANLPARLVRFGSLRRTIAGLTLEPVEHTLKRGLYSFFSYIITGQIDNCPITIYSALYAKRLSNHKKCE